MPVINQDWYVANEGREYPLDDSALTTDELGSLLPPDLIADLHMRWPNEYGEHAFLAALSVTPNLVTATFEAADDLDNPSQFRPLAVAVIRRPFTVRKQVLLVPQADGVGGWIVFGTGVLDRLYRGRFTSPRKGLLAKKAARSYRPLPVTGVRDIRAATLLTGVVTLRADPPLYVRKEEREIEGVRRDVIVIGLSNSADGEQFLPGALDASTAEPENVFARFAGPCAGRPESRSCDDPQPIEFINTVSPDCNGLVTLEFKGCTNVAQILEQCGIVVECHIGMTDICPPKHIPDDLGSLPDDVDSVISVSDSC